MTHNIGVSFAIVKSMISGKGEEGLEAGGKSNAGRLAQGFSWLVFPRNLVINQFPQKNTNSCNIPCQRVPVAEVGGDWTEVLQPGITLGPNNADHLNPPKGPKATVWDSEGLMEIGMGTLRLLAVAISSMLGVSGTLDGPGVLLKGDFG